MGGYAIDIIDSDRGSNYALGLIFGRFSVTCLLGSCVRYGGVFVLVRIFYSSFALSFCVSFDNIRVLDLSGAHDAI